jgi:hypothetical protein
MHLGSKPGRCTIGQIFWFVQHGAEQHLQNASGTYQQVDIVQQVKVGHV